MPGQTPGIVYLFFEQIPDLNHSFDYCRIVQLLVFTSDSGYKICRPLLNKKGVVVFLEKQNANSTVSWKNTVMSKMLLHLYLNYTFCVSECARVCVR